MTHEEAMNDDFQVPNGFLPSDKKQSTMTHNTQGGIARWVKAREEGKNNLPPISFSKQVIVRNIDTDEVKKCLNIGGVEGWADNDPNWLYYNTEWLDESPLPASPEGTVPEKLLQDIAAVNGFDNWSHLLGEYMCVMHNDIVEHTVHAMNLFAENVLQENERLRKQLAEAREALEQIKTIYDNVEDAAGVIAKKALSALK